ncbi:MAG: hypothetical protein HZB16_06210 [Armatimonadetes bacterium]|nr:hypothetical protein [Armatimonadota bacterium]
MEHGTTSPGPTGAAVVRRLALGRAVWLCGGWGSGKSELLADTAEALLADDGWLPLVVDLSDANGPHRLVERLVAALAEHDPSAASVAVPTHEWMAWLDAGPGVSEQVAVDAACRDRFGLPLLEARRRLGPDELARLLAEHAAARGLALPALRPAAERLAEVADHCLQMAGRRPVVLLDDADPGSASDLLEVLTALLVDLPEAYGQTWWLVAAAASPAPSELVDRLECLNLPSAPTEPTDDPLATICAAQAERVTVPALEDLRTDLLRESLAPLAGACTVVWENVLYRGEVRIADAPDTAWGEPLPADLAFLLIIMTRRGPLPASWPGDPRIAILRPGAPSGERRARLARALALETLARSLPDADLRAAAAARWPASRPVPDGEWLSDYTEGTLTAQPPLAGNWRETLAAAAPHLWAAALLRPRLAQCHTQRSLWIHSELLEEPLAEAQLAAMHRSLAGLERGDRAPRRALCLAQGSEPAGFAELRRRLAAQGGSLPVPDLLAELTAPPHGLTPDLVRLYLLAFVQRGEPATRLELVGPSGDLAWLSAADLPGQNWSTLDLKCVRRLARSDARSWPDLLAFARVLVPELTADQSPAALSEARARLREALAELRQQVRWVARSFDQLAQALDRPLPDEVEATLQRLARLATADSVESFGERLGDLYRFDLAVWRRVRQQLEGWRQLADQVDQVASFRAWLRDLRLPPQHPLEGDLLALTAQIDPARLLAQPHLARGLLAQAAQFRRQYAAVYGAAHAAHRDRLSHLAGQADAARRTRDAVARLNAIQALGPPLSIAPGLDELARRLTVCRREPDLTHRAVCPWCEWPMDEPAPAAELDALTREVEAGFGTRSRRLRELLTAEIIAQAGDDRLEALHQVLGMQSAATLPEVLTPETIDLLRACLPSGEPGLLARLRDAWPTVGAEEVEAAVAEFRRLLAEATAERGRVELS